MISLLRLQNYAAQVTPCLRQCYKNVKAVKKLLSAVKYSNISCQERTLFLAKYVTAAVAAQQMMTIQKKPT